MRFLEYRDLTRPDPLWEEVGIYGGYRWIEFPLDPSLWVSRRWEPHLAMFLELYTQGKTDKYTCNFACMKDFMDMLGDSGALRGRLPSYKDFTQVFDSRKALQLANQTKFAQDILRIDVLNNTPEFRLRYSLARESTVLVVGFSQLIEDMAKDRIIKKIFTDSDCYDSSIKVNKCSAEDILRFSDRCHVYLPADQLVLKSGVKNWSNVINYS